MDLTPKEDTPAIPVEDKKPTPVKTKNGPDASQRQQYHRTTTIRFDDLVDRTGENSLASTPPPGTKAGKDQAAAVHARFRWWSLALATGLCLLFLVGAGTVHKRSLDLASDSVDGITRGAQGVMQERIALLVLNEAILARAAVAFAKAGIQSGDLNLNGTLDLSIASHRNHLDRYLLMLLDSSEGVDEIYFAADESLVGALRDWSTGVRRIVALDPSTRPVSGSCPQYFAVDVLTGARAVGVSAVAFPSFPAWLCLDSLYGLPWYAAAMNSSQATLAADPGIDAGFWTPPFLSVRRAGGPRVPLQTTLEFGAAYSEAVYHPRTSLPVAALAAVVNMRRLGSELAAARADPGYEVVLVGEDGRVWASSGSEVTQKADVPGGWQRIRANESKHDLVRGVARRMSQAGSLLAEMERAVASTSEQGNLDPPLMGFADDAVYSATRVDLGGDAELVSIVVFRVPELATLKTQGSIATAVCCVFGIICIGLLVVDHNQVVDKNKAAKLVAARAPLGASLRSAPSATNRAPRASDPTLESHRANGEKRNPLRHLQIDTGEDNLGGSSFGGDGSLGVSPVPGLLPTPNVFSKKLVSSSAVGGGAAGSSSIHANEESRSSPQGVPLQGRALPPPVTHALTQSLSSVSDWQSSTSFRLSGSNPHQSLSSHNTPPALPSTPETSELQHQPSLCAMLSGADRSQSAPILAPPSLTSPVIDLASQEEVCEEGQEVPAGKPVAPIPIHIIAQSVHERLKRARSNNVSERVLERGHSEMLGSRKGPGLSPNFGGVGFQSYRSWKVAGKSTPEAKPRSLFSVKHFWGMQATSYLLLSATSLVVLMFVWRALTHAAIDATRDRTTDATLGLLEENTRAIFRYPACALRYEANRMSLLAEQGMMALRTSSRQGNGSWITRSPVDVVYVDALDSESLILHPMFMLPPAFLLPNALARVREQERQGVRQGTVVFDTGPLASAYYSNATAVDNVWFESGRDTYMETACRDSVYDPVTSCFFGVAAFTSTIGVCNEYRNGTQGMDGRYMPALPSDVTPFFLPVARRCNLLTSSSWPPKPKWSLPTPVFRNPKVLLLNLRWPVVASLETLVRMGAVDASSGPEKGLPFGVWATDVRTDKLLATLVSTAQRVCHRSHAKPASCDGRAFVVNRFPMSDADTGRTVPAGTLLASSHGNVTVDGGGQVLMLMNASSDEIVRETGRFLFQSLDARFWAAGSGSAANYTSVKSCAPPMYLSQARVLSSARGMLIPRDFDAPITVLLSIGVPSSGEWLLVLTAPRADFYHEWELEYVWQWLLVSAVSVLLLAFAFTGLKEMVLGVLHGVEGEIAEKDVGLVSAVSGNVTKEGLYSVFEEIMESVMSAAKLSWRHQQPTAPVITDNVEGGGASEPALEVEDRKFIAHCQKRASKHLRDGALGRNILTMCAMEANGTRTQWHLYKLVTNDYWRALLFLVLTFHVLLSFWEPVDNEALRERCGWSWWLPFAESLFLVVEIFTTAVRLLSKYKWGGPPNILDFDSRFERAYDSLSVLVLCIMCADWLTKLSTYWSIQYYFPFRVVLVVSMNSKVKDSCILVMRAIMGAKDVILFFMCTVLVAASFGTVLFGNWLQPMEVNGSFADAARSIMTTFVFLTSGENYGTVVFPATEGNGFYVIFFIVCSLIGLLLLMALTIGVLQQVFDQLALEARVKDRVAYRIAIISAFVLVDTDCSGMLDLAEVIAFFKRHRPHTDEEVLRRTFHEIAAREKRNQLGPLGHPEAAPGYDYDSNVRVGTEDTSRGRWYSGSGASSWGGGEDTEPVISERDVLISEMGLMGFTFLLEDGRLKLSKHTAGFPIQLVIRRLIKHPYWLHLQVTALILHLWMSLSYNLLPHDTVIRMLNYIFTAAFLVDVSLLLISYGPVELWMYNKYRSDERRSREDTFHMRGLIFIWLATVCLLLLSLFYIQDSPTVARLASVVACLRVFLYIESLRHLLFTIYAVLGQIISLVIFLLLVIFTFAVFGVLLFRGKFRKTLASERPDGSFDSLSEAMLVLFQLLVGEDWHQVMYATLKVTDWTACIYFIGYIVFITLLISNLFLGVVLQAFSKLMRLRGLSKAEVTRLMEGEGHKEPEKKPSMHPWKSHRVSFTVAGVLNDPSFSRSASRTGRSPTLGNLVGSLGSYVRALSPSARRTGQNSFSSFRSRDFSVPFSNAAYTRSATEPGTPPNELTPPAGVSESEGSASLNNSIHNANELEESAHERMVLRGHMSKSWDLKAGVWNTNPTFTHGKHRKRPEEPQGDAPNVSEIVPHPEHMSPGRLEQLKSNNGWHSS
eukprot:jgi/Mesvir1/22799/Mv14183-RA.1